LVSLLVGGKRVLSAWRHDREAGGAAAPTRRPADSVIGLLYTVDEHKRWSLRASIAALRAARGREVRFVLGSGPPFSTVYAAALVARRLKVPFVADFRDPLVGGGTGIPSALSGRLQSAMERRILTQAQAVCVASPGIAADLRARHPAEADKIRVILNGFDGAPAPRIRDTGHRLDILFAGSLYGNRDPFPFLDAVESMLCGPAVDASRIRIRFIGDCAAFRGVRLASWTAGRRIARVLELLPQLPPAELAHYVEQATVVLNFAQHQPRQIPAKTFEHLASGREVLAICETDSDTGRLLAGIPGTLCIDPAAPAAMAGVLRDLYHRHAVLGLASAPSLENVLPYSRNIQNEKFRGVLDSIA
jgi:hypothetical protein